jgi:intracellular protein transport protein USO1
MEFFNQTYIALRGPTGAPQTALDTIGRLSDRLSPSTLLADRRAAVLALKGLSRDCKQDVGDRALPGLVEVLHNDAEIDADIGKAVLETLNILCETEDGTPGGKEIAFKHTDYILANEKTAHTLFSLLGDANFYIRYATLQYLTTLLQNRRQVIQTYFLKVAAGPASVIAVLDDKREITRNGELLICLVEDWGYSSLLHVLTLTLL